MTHGTAIAAAYLEAGNADAAITELKALLAQDPSHREALALLASAYADKGDFQRSVSVAEDLIAGHPDYDVGYRLKAAFLSGLRKRRAALEPAKRAVELNPSDPENHHILALILQECHRFSEAEEAFERTLELAPESTEAKANYSLFLLSRGREPQAQQLFDEAAASDPGRQSVIIARGILALRRGHIEEALANALWALRQDATDERALHLLAQIKMRKNPVLGLWWRCAVSIDRYTALQPWVILFTAILGSRIGYDAVKHSSFGLPALILAVALLGFVVLAWMGPFLLKRMVTRELKAVSIRPF